MTIRADLDRPVTVAEAAKVLLVAGLSVQLMDTYDMTPDQKMADKIVRAAWFDLRALSHEGGE